MGAGQLVVAILTLALLTEWLTERFFGWWLKEWPMIAVSTVLGIGLCLLFAVDGMSALGLPQPMFSPWTGEVLTGLVIGAGSNAVHKFFGKYIPETK